MRRTHCIWLVGTLILLAALLPWDAAPGHAQEGICDAAPQPRLSIGGWAAVNDIVAQTATGGLRLRAEPRVSAAEVDVLPPRTLARVVDGPACNDGFWWWYLSVTERGVEGWSAEAIAGSYYLMPTVAPPPTATPVAFPTNTPQAPSLAAAAPLAAAPPPGGEGAAAQMVPGGDYTLVARLVVDLEQTLAVTLSPDGRLAALALVDRVRLLDAAGLTPLADLAAATGEPRALAFSPDGATLLVGYADGALIWWDTAAGTVARQERMAAGVAQVACGSDGLTSAAADESGQLVLYGPVGSPTRSLAVFPADEPLDWTVKAVRFDEGSPRLLVGLERQSGPLGRVTLYDLADLTATASVGGAHSKGAFLPEGGAVLLYGNSTLPATRWDPAAGVQDTLTGTQGWDSAVPLSGTLIALGGSGGLKLYDTATRQDVAVLSTGAAMVAAASSSGDRLIALVAGEAMLWGTGGGTAAPAPAGGGDTGAVSCPEDLTTSYLRLGAITQVADQAHPVRLREEPRADSFFLEVVYQDQTLTVAEGPTCADSFRWWRMDVAGRTGWTVEAANGRYLLIDPNNPPPSIVFAEGLTEVPPAPPPPPPDVAPTPRPQTPPTVVRRAAYTPDGTRLVVGADGGVRLYDASSLTLLNTLPVGPVLDLVTIQGGLYAVTWATEGIRLVTVPGGEVWAILTGAPHDPAWAAAAPDGQWLILGPTSDGQTATLWNLQTVSSPETPPYWWPGWGVISASFSPDNGYVLINDVVYRRSCDVAGSGCLFDLIRTDFTAAGIFGSVAWSASGGRMIGFSDRLWVWDVNTIGVGFTLRSTLTMQDPRRVALNGDGTRGAIVARGLMELWDLVEGSYVANRVVELPGAVSDLAFRPDGAQLVAAAGERVTVYDPLSGNVIRQVE